MKSFIMVLLCSLLLASPCFADEGITSRVGNSVNTDAYVKNNTSTDYGWVGIKSIMTRIETANKMILTAIRVFRYDASGLVAELRITEREYERIGGRWVLRGTSVIPPIEPSRYAQYLGAGDVFDVTVVTNLPSSTKSQCKVSIIVATLDGSGAPTDDIVVTIENRYIFNPNINMLMVRRVL